MVLAAKPRHALVDWAARNDGVRDRRRLGSRVRYDREPVGVLQGLAPDRVAAIGTRAPGVWLTGLAAGFHAVAHLPGQELLGPLLFLRLGDFGGV
ncbi:MAG TPA: hypothetical protein VMK13_07140 [Streptosporangiaceae bacterium]|nr:hypothetical protein [Streptosporangiaceae bacterium]